MNIFLEMSVVKIWPELCCCWKKWQ